MKAVIATLHRVKNYGSVLQTYASMRMFEKMDTDARILDYVPERLDDGNARRLLTENSVKASGGIKKLIHKAVVAPSYKKQKKVFDAFLEKYVRMTERYTRKELEAHPPKADIWCTGSDQVFNTEINGGIDGPFYLDFAPDEDKKIAFSASFGLKGISEDTREETARLLKRYDALSFREQTGVDMAASLGINDPVRVLDPAMCLTKEEWCLLARDIPKEKAKYILIYELNGESDIGSTAKLLSGKTGLKVIRASYYWHHFTKYGKLRFCPEVEKFLALVRDAEYVITDSFHATALSVLFEKQFYSVLPPKYGSRVENILKVFGLEDRLVSGGVFSEKPIDYKKVGAILERERANTFAYLENAVGGKIRKAPDGVYMAYARDESLRERSSSGGAFGVLARNVLNNNGVVYGCAMEGMKARHIRVDSIEKLDALHGSKYTPSDMTGVTEMVRKDLDEGRQVLFSGMPCQISGLYAAVGRHEDLLTVELVCHGVPEGELFSRYISSLGEVSGYRFRDKALGWGNAISYDVKRGGETKHIVAPSKLDSYYGMFYHGYSLRDACIKCRFARPERTGDVTVGDFWGAEKTFPKVDGQKGLSLVMINSQKGRQYLDVLREEMTMLPSDFAEASAENRSLVTGTADTRERQRVLAAAKKGYSDAEKEYRRSLSIRERLSRLKTKLKFTVYKMKRKSGNNAA